MSIIAFRETVSASSVETIYVETARPFINGLTFSLFSSAVLAAQVGVRLSSSGQTILPVPVFGGSNDIWLENHAPILIVVNKEVVGPPYRLAIRIDNTGNASDVIVSGILEVYNTPYPQTRIKFPEGHEGKPDPFLEWLTSLQADETDKK